MESPLQMDKEQNMDNLPSEIRKALGPHANSASGLASVLPVVLPVGRECGDRCGIRTHDLLIKSQLLYRLS
jgi:hypothetical protein